MRRGPERAMRENVGAPGLLQMKCRPRVKSKDHRYETFKVTRREPSTPFDFAQGWLLLGMTVSSYHGKTSDHRLPQNVLRLERWRSCCAQQLQCALQRKGHHHEPAFS